MSATEVRLDEPVELTMRMDPHWVFIDDIRRFVEAFCLVACPGTDRESQLALATHELVQNAVANAAAPGIELRLAVDRRKSRVALSVTNVVAPGQAELVRERIARLSAEPDTLQSYLAAMSENPHGKGGIGLARIRHEAELELDVTTDGPLLTVHAAGPLRPADRPPLQLVS